LFPQITEEQQIRVASAIRSVLGQDTFGGLAAYRRARTADSACRSHR
jgi:hypothetical protein